MRDLRLYFSIIFVVLVSSLTLFFVAPAFGKDPRPASASDAHHSSANGGFSKEVLTSKITSIQKSYRSRIEAFDNETIRLISEVKNLKINASLSRVMETLEESLESIRVEKKELGLRQEFLDQLLFQTESYYSGGDATEFFQDRLLNMALREYGVGTLGAQFRPSYARFLVLATIALGNLPEHQQNPVDFLIGYMEKTSISKPSIPQTSDSDYSNGRDMVSARPTSLEQAAQSFEER